VEFRGFYIQVCTVKRWM